MADGPMTLEKFREIMLGHDNIFVDSTLFRNEFTYFVNYQILRMPEEYGQDFVKPPFEAWLGSIKPRETIRNTMVSQFTLMDNLRNDRDTYKDANREMMRDTTYAQVKNQKVGGTKAMAAMRESVDIMD